MSEVVVGLGSLQNRLAAISGPDAGRAFMERVALRTLTEMKNAIPAKTGFTRKTLHVGNVSAVGATIVGSQNALWLDQGTRPHVIKPKNGKVLAWSTGGRRLSGRPTVAARRSGQIAFATIVHHPGTRAQPFISASIRVSFGKSGLSDVVTERWNSAA